MKNHMKKLFGIILLCNLFLLLPTVIAISDSYDMGTLMVSHSHRIDKDFHNGRIVFTFMANASLTVYISHYFENASLNPNYIFHVTGTNASCNESVNTAYHYYYFFAKSTGYAVHIDFILEGNPGSGIPGFELIFTILVIMGTIGLISLRKKDFI